MSRNRAIEPKADCATIRCDLEKLLQRMHLIIKETHQIPDDKPNNRLTTRLSVSLKSQQKFQVIIFKLTQSRRPALIANYAHMNDAAFERLLKVAARIRVVVRVRRIMQSQQRRCEMVA